MSSIIKNTRNIILRDGITTVFNLLTTILLARKLGPELLGIWFVYLTIYSLLDALFRTKTETSSVFYLASKRISFAELERCLLLITSLSILFSLMIFICLNDEIYNYFFAGFNENYRLHFYTVVLLLSLSMFATCYFYLALGMENYKIYNLTIVGQACMNFCCVCALTIIMADTILIPIVSINFSWFFAALIGFKYFRKNTNHDLNFISQETFSNIPVLLKSGLQVYVSSLIKIFQDQLPRLFIIGIFPTSYLAYLAQSQLIINLLIRFCTAIGNVLYPRLASLDNMNQKVLITNVVRISLILNAALLLSLYFIIDDLVVAVYGKEYIEVANYLKILIPSAFMLIPALLLEQFINAHGDFKYKILISIISCLAMAISLLFFYSDLNTTNIAVSIAFANVVQALVVILIIERKYSISPFSLLPTVQDGVHVLKFFKLLR